MTENLDLAINELHQMGARAKKAAKVLTNVSTQDKNQALELMAQSILDSQADILQANQLDIQAGEASGLSKPLIERLTLNPGRIASMAQGLRTMAQLNDPTQETIKGWVNADGLRISQRRIPLGVIGIIYESRPNVTADASGLCLKAGNAVILRGGSDALNSNQAILKAIHHGLDQSQIPEDAVQLITNPSRQLASEFMKLNDYVDCLIPRGGAGLIKAVANQATIPVIETGIGNCHIYIHEQADLEKAIPIVINAKTQRPSVCNAVETLLVDAHLAETSLRDIIQPLIDLGVEIRGCAKTQAYLQQDISLASEEDYQTEYLDLILAVKVVDNWQAAINHIDNYSTGHSDAIITEDYQVAQEFMNQVNSASVYVNASTRFTDGEVFGFGGEIGISTQKLHARGPMGLEALTSYKYVIEGQGQIRQ